MVDFEDFLNFIKSQEYYCDQKNQIQHIPQLNPRYDDLYKL